MVAALKMRDIIKHVMELVLTLNLDRKMVMIVDCISHNLLDLQISWIANCMGQTLGSWAAFCAGYDERGPRAFCVGCKMRGSARDAKRVARAQGALAAVQLCRKSLH